MTQITRRKMIAAAAAIPVAAAITHTNRIVAQDATPEASPEASPQALATSPVGKAPAIGWSFTVWTFQDPYLGEIRTPRNSELAPGQRYVGLEVEIGNDAGQPLQFKVSDIRLRDSNNQEYTSAGGVGGTEPKLVQQALPEGEHTRGWLWFIMTDDMVINEARFEAPSPLFRVDVAAQ